MITRIVTKVRQPLIISTETKSEWCKIYTETGKLPSNDIPCNKCTMGITCTHGNLHSKVKKFGGINNLLTKFVCKTCKSNVKEEADLQQPRVKKDKVAVERKRAIQREEDIQKGIAPNDNGRYNIPTIDLNPTRKSYSIEQIAQDPQLTHELTTGCCLKPQLFLNNDSNCTGCQLYENCNAGCKNLPKSKRSALA